MMYLLPQFLFKIILLLYIVKNEASTECVGKATICEKLSKEQCEECIRADRCCLWIYQKDINDVPRCTIESKLPPNINKNLIKSQKTFVKITDNKKFSTLDSGVEEIYKDEPSIQIRPQKIDVTLREGESINTKLFYKAIQNYPLDIYYLMDLTYSMKPHKKQLSELSKKLAVVLKNLTENYRIAFGYYSDKVALPYYQMSETVRKNPCLIENITCESGYNFRHAYNFSKNLESFTYKVNESMHTANNDDLEGGFDALLQIILCKNELGWRNHARKIVIIATDSLMHTAGDGILAGITKKPDSNCRLEKSGQYMVYSGAEYDYPSVGEIYSKLIDSKINVLFAVDKKVESYYEQIKNLMPELTKVGLLDDDPDKFLILVRKTYTGIVEKVRLHVKNPKENLRITFTANNCKGYLVNDNDTECSDIIVGKEYEFEINIELLELPQDNRLSDNIIIEEMNIKEILQININYVGSYCDCPDFKDGESIDNGHYRCGKYECNNGWIGEKCDKECDWNYGRFVNETYTSLTCLNRGEFDLDTCKCDCDPEYIGEFCQFNQCPRNSIGEVCSNHGRCHEGVCICNEDYSGDFCDCPKSNHTCIKPGTDIVCSNHGKCKCGKCSCDYVYGNDYGGQFCEKCLGCKNLCNKYKEEVAAAIINKSWTPKYISEMNKVEHFNEDDESRLCLHIFDDDKSRKHSVTYIYDMKEDSTFRVIISYMEEITNPVNQATFGITVATVVVAVLLSLLFGWRLYTLYVDRKEWKLFETELADTMYGEGNPLYKSPISMFKNPMRTTKSTENL